MLSMLRLRKAYAEESHIEDVSDLGADLSEFAQFLPPPTGLERLKWFFIPNSYGFRSLEARMISSAVFTTAMVGLAVGGLRSVRRSSERFITANRLSVFQNHKDAKVRVRDQVVFTFWKEGLKLATKMSFLVGVYTFTCFSQAAYRNHLKTYDFVTSAAFSFGLFRAHLGLKAFGAGCAIGGFSGLLFVGLFYPILYLKGISYDDLYQQIRQEHWTLQLDEIQKRLHVEMELRNNSNISWVTTKDVERRIEDQERQLAADRLLRQQLLEKEKQSGVKIP